jgi:hypothetical protein
MLHVCQSQRPDQVMYMTLEIVEAVSNEVGNQNSIDLLKKLHHSVCLAIASRQRFLRQADVF